MSKSKSETSVEERRAHERQEASLDLRGTPEHGGVVAHMTARNLSLGGVYCTSGTDFPEMTRLAVRLMLPLPGSNGGHPLDLEAVVVRREALRSLTGAPRYELALYFTGVDAATRSQLERFLGRPSH